MYTGVPCRVYNRTEPKKRKVGITFQWKDFKMTPHLNMIMSILKKKQNL